MSTVVGIRKIEMSRLLSQSVRNNAYFLRGGLRESSSSTLGKGRYPVVWNHVGAHPSMNHTTLLRGIRLYHHANHHNNIKNNRVLLASLQKEERKTAEGLLEWIWKQVKVPKGTYVYILILLQYNVLVLVKMS